MLMTYQVTFKDDGEKQRFPDIVRFTETDDEYILLRQNGPELSFYKVAIDKPICISFTLIAIEPNPPPDE